MTEKRADYRKRQKKSVLNKVKSAFSDDADQGVDVVSDFQKNETEKRRPLKGDGEEFYQAEPIDKNDLHQQKSLKLKKRLNRAILIVFVLIVLVLLALFHL